VLKRGLRATFFISPAFICRESVGGTPFANFPVAIRTLFTHIIAR
jgi:hypothetical protein